MSPSSTRSSTKTSSLKCSNRPACISVSVKTAPRTEAFTVVSGSWTSNGKASSNRICDAGERPKHCTSPHTTPHHATPQHNTRQHATPRHYTAHHGTPRHSTTLHGTTSDVIIWKLPL